LTELRTHFEARVFELNNQNQELYEQSLEVERGLKVVIAEKVFSYNGM
jgi:hypothetical protein